MKITLLFKNIYHNFLLKVFPSNAKIVGECNLCGECCKGLYLIYKGKTLKTEEQFEKMKKSFSVYRHFEIIGSSEEGLEFKCNKLKDNKCSIYKGRPFFCRKYPKQQFHLKQINLPEDCGYNIKPRIKFEDMMKIKKET